MFHFYGSASLGSLWYWVLSILVWSYVCNRTLGVPHGMVRRAGREPELADRVDLLALIMAERIGEIHDRAGVLVAGMTGFALAVIGFVGFVLQVEFAKAVFLLAFPLTIVAYSTLRLALYVRAVRLNGAHLRRLLVTRRFWHTVVAVSALMIAASLAVIEHPALLVR